MHSKLKCSKNRVASGILLLLLTIVGPLFTFVMLLGAKLSSEQAQPTAAVDPETGHPTALASFAPTAAPASSPTFYPGDVIRTPDFEIQVTKVELRKSVGSEFFQSNAANGVLYLAVQWSYKNISSAPKNMFETPSFAAIDPNGAEYSEDVGAASSFVTELELTEKVVSDLNPGIKVDGAAVFEVSEELAARPGWVLLVSADQDVAVSLEERRTGDTAVETLNGVGLEEDDEIQYPNRHSDYVFDEAATVKADDYEEPTGNPNASAQGDSAVTTKGRITGDNVRFRSIPSTDGDVIASLKKGDLVEILEEVSPGAEWVHVRKDGVEGWVHVDYVEIMESDNTFEAGPVVSNEDSPPERTMVFNGETITARDVVGSWMHHGVFSGIYCPTGEDTKCLGYIGNYLQDPKGGARDVGKVLFLKPELAAFAPEELHSNPRDMDALQVYSAMQTPQGKFFEAVLAGWLHYALDEPLGLRYPINIEDNYRLQDETLVVGLYDSQERELHEKDRRILGRFDLIPLNVATKNLIAGGFGMVSNIGLFELPGVTPEIANQLREKGELIMVYQPVDMAQAELTGTAYGTRGVILANLVEVRLVKQQQGSNEPEMIERRSTSEAEEVKESALAVSKVLAAPATNPVPKAKAPRTANVEEEDTVRSSDADNHAVKETAPSPASTKSAASSHKEQISKPKKKGQEPSTPASEPKQEEPVLLIPVGPPTGVKIK